MKHTLFGAGTLGARALMWEAEVILFLGPFLYLAAMMTEPDVRAFFSHLEGSESSADCPWLLCKNPLAKEASGDSALPRLRAWAEIYLSGKQDCL